MALNVNDSNQVQLFTQQQLAQGIPQEEIDTFIQGEQTKSPTGGGAPAPASTTPTAPTPQPSLDTFSQQAQQVGSITLPNGRTVTRDEAFNAKLTDPKNTRIYDQIIDEIDRKATVAGKTETKPSDVRLIDNLESLFFGEGEQDPLAFGVTGLGGRLPGFAKQAERAISPGVPGSATERLNTYIRTLESIRPQLAKMAGDSGNIAFAEQVQAGKGLPQATDTPSEAIDIMQSARTKFGLQPSQRLEQLRQEIGTDVLSKAPPTLGGTLVKAGKGIGRFLIGEHLDIGQDVIQSIVVDRRIDDIGEAQKEALRLAKQGKSAEAEAILNNILVETQALSEGFSESVEESPLERGAGVALEALTLAGLPGAAKGVAKGGRALLKKGFSPRVAVESLEEGLKVAKKGSVMREKAVKTAQKAGKKVDGNAIFKGITKWAKEARKAFPKSGSEIDDFVGGLESQLKGKKLSPEAAKRIWDLTDSGFSQAGKTGTGAAKSFFREYRGLVRTGIEKVAPGFDEGTKQIAKGLNQEKLLKSVRTGLQRKELRKGLIAPVPQALKKVGGRIAGGAAAGLGLAAIAKLLGIRLSGAAEQPR